MSVNPAVLLLAVVGLSGIGPAAPPVSSPSLVSGPASGGSSFSGSGALWACTPMQYGDPRKNCVRLLQHLLRARGAALPETGLYLTLTRDGVGQFQQDRGFPQTGVVDDRTRRGLEQLPPEGTELDLRRECVTLSRNNTGGPASSGRCVLALRHRLNGYGADLAEGDIFDADTDAAVREFQVNAGLPALGLVGPLTKAALYRPLPPPPAPHLMPGCTDTGCAIFVSRHTTRNLATAFPKNQIARHLIAAAVARLACRLVTAAPTLQVVCRPVIAYILATVADALVRASEQNACLVVTFGYPPGSNSWSPLRLTTGTGSSCRD
jgi:hypothetical protein